VINHKLKGLGWSLLLAQTCAYAAVIDNPCAALSAIVNRPSFSDSACAVPQNHLVIESGYQYQKLKGRGTGSVLPQLVMRWGLPSQNEFLILLPNYTYQNAKPNSGFSATVVGLKHEFAYTAKWLNAIEGELILPTGSRNYGSHALGATFNGISVYTFNPAWALTMMLGITNQALSQAAGGKRYTSVNPDLLLNWQINPKTSTYIEVAGQSKTQPGSSKTAFNSDVGLIYLLRPQWEVDVAIGQRLSGQLGQYSHYVNVGMSFLV
jgi:hypothetical protein